MKKLFITMLLFVLATVNVAAQDNDSKITLNTRAWTTNYWTSLIGGAVETSIKHLFKGHEKDSLWAERILPDPDLVFPIGLSKHGFHGERSIYGPYHYAFGNPFKHLGDWGIGVDASYKPCNYGVYGGVFYKSQEIVSKVNKQNIRGYYFQPRAGLVAGADDCRFEAGVFYDVVTACGGSFPGGVKNWLKGGWGLDFGLSTSDKKGHTQFMLQFSMPLHNFVNDNHPGFEGARRRVGYIMLSQRVNL